MLENFYKSVEHVGDRLFEAFHLIGLFVIGMAVLWASWHEVFLILEHGGPTVSDILLLFIYLELGAMVGIFFRTKQLPVRFLVYIAITALTRLLAIDVKAMDSERMILITLAILILTIAALALRFASHHYPSRDLS